MPVEGGPMTPENAALGEVIDLAYKMGLRPTGRGRYAHICAFCKHESSRHTGGPVFVCPCGCEVGQGDDGNPGIWLSERDYLVWHGAFPMVVRLDV